MGFLNSIGKLASSVTGGDLLGAATSIGGGVLGFMGQKSANSAAQASTREQMDFQREMSSTEVQRRKADLVAAGMNPKLAATAGAATSGGGASYTPANEGAAARDVALQLAQIKNVNASTEKTRADTRLSNAEADKAEVLKAPYAALKAIGPTIKSSARDMADFYSGDSPTSPKGIYNWLRNGMGNSSARDISSRPNYDAIARELKRGNSGIKIKLPSMKGFE